MRSTSLFGLFVALTLNACAIHGAGSLQPYPVSPFATVSGPRASGPNASVSSGVSASSVASVSSDGTVATGVGVGGDVNAGAAFRAGPNGGGASLQVQGVGLSVQGGRGGQSATITAPGGVVFTEHGGRVTTNLNPPPSEPPSEE